jgi:hypothetical protein
VFLDRDKTLDNVQKHNICSDNSLSYRQLVGLLGRGINTSQGRYLNRRTQVEKNAEKKIHALSEIRTHDLNVQACLDGMAAMIDRKI